MAVGVGRNGQSAGQSPVRLGHCYTQPRGGGEKFPVPFPFKGEGLFSGWPNARLGFPPPLRGRARVGGQKIPQCVMALALLFEITAGGRVFSEKSCPRPSLAHGFPLKTAGMTVGGHGIYL